MRIALMGNYGHGLKAVQDGIRLGHEIAGYCGETPKYEKVFEAAGLAPKKYGDWKTMLGETGPDIFIADCLMNEHAKVTSYALGLGIHVYCEKPLATTFEDYETVRDAWKRSGKLLWSMQDARYYPGVYTLKHLIDRGAIGDVRMITGQKSYQLGNRAAFYSSREVQGGLIPWVAIHMVDAVNYVYPKKTLEVFARHSSLNNFGNGELEMTSMSMMTMENEVLAYVNADFLRPGSATSHGDDRLRVAGTDGVIENIRNEVRLINKDNDGTPPVELMKPPGIFEDFLNAVTDGGGEMTGESTLNATYLSLKLRESADTGKLIVL